MLLTKLPTPSLIVDRAKLQRNIERMRDHLAKLKVPLRPHLKSSKCAEIARLAIAGQPGGITVSTLKEAAFFLDAGISDILYAVGISPAKLAEVYALQQRGAQITVLLDSIVMAKIVVDTAQKMKTIFPVLIEIDTDGHRAGIRPNDPQIIEIGRLLDKHPFTRLVGVLTHAGESYHCASRDELVAMAEQERSGAVDAAERLRRSGLPCSVVSVGSTPTALFAQNLDGVTEVRAGVYMFNDLVMSDIGVCNDEDIAISVLATVIGHSPSTSRLFIDAGGLALSKDRGSELNGGASYGKLIDPITGEAIGMELIDTNQEHGIVSAAGDDFMRLPIGAMVRVLPNHACMTAAAYDHYNILDGNEVSDVWRRCNGW